MVFNVTITFIKIIFDCWLLFFIVQDPREAVIWMAVHHKQKKALEFFSREIAPAGTGMGELKPHTLF